MFRLNKVSRFVLILVLSSVLLTTLNSEIVKAENTIIINHDGSVDGADLLQRNDNTYTFLNDVSGNIVILKDSVILDGAGFTLKGSGESSQTGISLAHRKNVTIKNIEITDFVIGISSGPAVNTSTNITIWGNYIHDCVSGIELLGSYYNLIQFNTFRNNSLDIGLAYVFGYNFITQNNLDSFVGVWVSDQPTIDMNYWTAYNGTDNDGDGIGDSPYYYHEILQDNNPLMNPVPIIPEFPSWLFLPLFFIFTLILFIAKRRSKFGALKNE